MIKLIKHKFKHYIIEPEKWKNWDEPTVREFKGKKVVGRPTKGYGDSTFTYAGKEYKPEPWSNNYLVNAIKENIEKMFDAKFTFCLCGYYGEDGKGLPHHSDTVPTLDDLVVSISLGGPRIFQWHQYDCQIKPETNTSELYKYIQPVLGVNVEEHNYILEDGDIIVFDGNSQMCATHAVLPMEHAAPRINLTYRTGI
jgi:alkylated DNA repair dioxygenase AlkB